MPRGKHSKKRASKPAYEEGSETTFMHPSLHPDVELTVSDHITSTWFNNDESDLNSNREYSTYVMGKFTCENNKCSSRNWTSGKVTILIRSFSNNGYNASVFNQRCKRCEHLGTFTLDNESYIDRVSYRIKKWAGVRVEQPQYTTKHTPPHKSDLCEGCKIGVCGQRG